MQQLKNKVEGAHTVKERITQDKQTECYVIKEARDYSGRLLYYEYVRMIRQGTPDWKNRDIIFK